PGGADELMKLIRGKTVCFAGQSAVGKSSLINALAGVAAQETGGLSKKTDRGRHTTRRTELIDLGEGTFVVDTCGFSMLETVDIPPEELRLYYDDFEPLRPRCRFSGCTHTEEPDCAVRAEVGKSVGAGRYQRYLAIYGELLMRRKTKYD
ncbi:MAG TPA: ribosome small subunit-dependent GTPase A, partial [Candidatus Limadaptatus stercoripullorum]|nr:ribosome small subunit-dependent GTPase A [Candidatus Limadaptatus stercoripullorum]